MGPKRKGQKSKRSSTPGRPHNKPVPLRAGGEPPIVGVHPSESKTTIGKTASLVAESSGTPTVTAAPPRPSRIKLILQSLSALSLCLTLLGVCMATRTPAWYQPVSIDTSDLQSIRDRLSEITVAFNRGLASRTAFEWVIREQELNEWIACRQEIYPESAGWIPRELTDVVMATQEGLIKIGARIDQSVYRGVISLGLSASVEGDQVRIRMTGTGIGTLPLPTQVIGNLVARFVKGAPELKDEIATSRSSMQSPDLKQLLSEGLLIKNEFTHPEGDWRFRLRSLDIRHDEIRLGIEPI